VQVFVEYQWIAPVSAADPPFPSCNRMTALGILQEDKEPKANSYGLQANQG